MAGRTSADSATSAWVVMAPMTSSLPFAADAAQLGHLGQRDQIARRRQPQLHDREEALAAAEDLALAGGLERLDRTRPRPPDW